MFLIVVLGNVVVQIPMAALAGVMIMVSIGTFDWGSVRNIHKTPLSDAAVMVITVVTVVLTHNLAYGVLAGVVLSMIFFAVKISRVRVLSLYMNEAEKRIYYVQGQLFFASVTEFQESIEFNEIPSVKEVIIDLSESHLWDDSAIGALDSVEAKFEQKGIDVTFVGINAESRRLLEKVGGVSKTSS